MREKLEEYKALADREDGDAGQTESENAGLMARIGRVTRVALQPPPSGAAAAAAASEGGSIQ